MPSYILPFRQGGQDDYKLGALEVVKQEFYLSRQPFFHVDTKNLKSVDFSYKTLVLQLLRHLVYNYLKDKMQSVIE